MSESNITIPPEARQAVWEAFVDAAININLSTEECLHAACLAMLRAWETDTHRMIVSTALDEVGGTYPAIILPMQPEREPSE